MSLEPPEWVFVWWWLRFLRDPQVMDALPQQDFYAPRPVPMSPEVYEQHRADWVEAGSPKVPTRQIMAAMGASSEIPF